MAITDMKQMFSNADFQRDIARVVALRYNLTPDRDVHISLQENLMTAETDVVFDFSPAKLVLPAELRMHLDNVGKKLHDPFRGPVIQAAVPELHKDLEALLVAFEKLDKPYRVATTLSAIRQLLE